MACIRYVPGLWARAEDTYKPLVRAMLIFSLLFDVKEKKK